MRSQNTAHYETLIEFVEKITFTDRLDGSQVMLERCLEGTTNLTAASYSSGPVYSVCKKTTNLLIILSRCVT